MINSVFVLLYSLLNTNNLPLNLIKTRVVPFKLKIFVILPNIKVVVIKPSVANIIKNFLVFLLIKYYRGMSTLVMYVINYFNALL